MAKYNVTDWKIYSKNSLRGFFTLQLLDYGLEIRDCMLHEKNGNRWVSFPAKPMLSNGSLMYNENGKAQYSFILNFYDKNKYNEMQSEVLNILKHI